MLFSGAGKAAIDFWVTRQFPNYCMSNFSQTMNQRRPTVMRSCVVENECVASTNFPDNYPNSDRCVVQAVHLDPQHPPVIHVEAFDIESGWDFLTVNGIEYSGVTGPSAVVPQGNITWSADAQPYNCTPFNLASSIVSIRHCLIMSGGRNSAPASDVEACKDTSVTNQGWKICAGEASATLEQLQWHEMI